MTAAAGAIYRHFESKFPPPAKGALRVWWVPQIPGKQFHWPVGSLDEAASLMDALAAYDDFQYAEKVKPDYCNGGGLEQFDGEVWMEWESEDGDDFDTWRRS